MAFWLSFLVFSNPANMASIPCSLLPCWILLQRHLAPNPLGNQWHLHLHDWLFRLQFFCLLHSEWCHCLLGCQSLPTYLLSCRIVLYLHLASDSRGTIRHLYMCSGVLCGLQFVCVLRSRWWICRLGGQSLSDFFAGGSTGTGLVLQ